MKKMFALMLLFLAIGYSSPAQALFKLQAGFGYIEHLSVGPMLTAGRHNITLLYGSNAFIQPREFSTFMLEYCFDLKSVFKGKIVPSLGVRGGHIIFTDKYYRWEVATVIPYVRSNYSLNYHINLFLDFGASFSFEQSVKRLQFGEIGKYKDLLPELKIGTSFRLR